MSRYSEFIEFPIYLYSSKEVEVDAAEEEADEAAADEDVSDAEDVADEAGEALSGCLSQPMYSVTNSVRCSGKGQQPEA